MNLIDVIVTCPFCGRESVISVDFDDFTAWQSGELAQECFPYLSAGEREVLISGMCAHCQEDFFGSLLA